MPVGSSIISTAVMASITVPTSNDNAASSTAPPGYFLLEELELEAPPQATNWLWLHQYCRLYPSPHRYDNHWVTVIKDIREGLKSEISSILRANEIPHAVLRYATVTILIVRSPNMDVALLANGLLARRLELGANRVENGILQSSKAMVMLSEDDRIDLALAAVVPIQIPHAATILPTLPVHCTARATSSGSFFPDDQHQHMQSVGLSLVERALHRVAEASKHFVRSTSATLTLERAVSVVGLLAAGGAGGAVGGALGRGLDARYASTGVSGQPQQGPQERDYASDFLSASKEERNELMELTRMRMELTLMRCVEGGRVTFDQFERYMEKRGRQRTDSIQIHEAKGGYQHENSECH